MIFYWRRDREEALARTLVQRKLSLYSLKVRMREISPETFMRDPTCWNRHETYSHRVQSQYVAAPPPHTNILFGHPTLKQGTRPSLSMHAVAPHKLCCVVRYSRYVADTVILAFV